MPNHKMTLLMILLLINFIPTTTHALTDVPPPNELISIDTAPNITELHQINYGTVQQLSWNNSQLVVTTTTGVVFYDEASLNTGEALSFIREGRGEVFNSQQFDGQSILAAIREDDTVFLYHAESNQTIEVSDSPESTWIRSSAFSLDGGYLAMTRSGTGYDISIWDTQTGALLHRLSGDNSVVSGLTFSPDGTLLAVVNEDWIVYLWDVATGALVSSFSVPEGSAGGAKSTVTDQTLTFSPNGAYLAVNGWRSTLWNIQTGQEPIAVQESLGPAHAFAFSPDGDSLVAASNNNTLIIYSTSTWDEITSFQANNDYFYGITVFRFSPDSRLLAVAGDGITIGIWDITTATEVYTLSGFTPPIGSIAFSPDGETLAVLGADYNDFLQLWNVHSLTLQMTLPATVGSRLGNLDFTPDGERLLTSSGYWQLRDGTGPFPLDNCCPDIEIGYLSGNLLIFSELSWDIAALNEAVIAAHEGWANDFAFSPDGETLASVSGEPELGDVEVPVDDSLRLWDVQTAQQIAAFAQDAPIFSVAFSPDGTLIATGSYDTTITLWDTAAGTVVGTLRGHTGAVNHLIFSTDGTLLISSGGDHTIRLWDVAAQTQVKVLEGHVDWINDLDLSPDGTMLASASHDGTVRLWGSQLDE